MGSLVAQDNRTTPLLVVQCVNWATTDRENREVNRKSKIYRIDIQQWRVPFAFNCTIWDVIFQILKIYSIYTKRATFLYWSRSWQLKYYMITNICTWCSCNFFREGIMQYHKKKMYISLKQDNAHNCCIHVANHLTIMKHWFLKKKNTLINFLMQTIM